MFQHVVRWTFFITIWKKYKAQLLTTLGYLLALLLVSLIHKDYLDYVATSNDEQDFIATSFILKWIAYITLTASYFYLFSRFSKKAEIGHENLSFLRKFQKQSQSSSSKKTNKATNGNGSFDKPKEEGDPFANIRTKAKLRSEADLLMDKDNNAKN